jgi:hypothetical protein
VKKNELKEMLKPIIKECVREALYEEGLLANVVTEVVKGMRATTLVESTQRTPARRATAPAAPATPAPNMEEHNRATRQKVNEHRRKLMKAIGGDSYNGIDLFEGTQPMKAHEATDAPPGGVDLGDLSDSGVDISSIMGGASRMWAAMK